MVPKFSGATILAAPVSEPCTPTVDDPKLLVDLQSRLNDWFGVGFALFDGGTGDLLTYDARVMTSDILALGEMCRAVAAGGKAEFVEDVEPMTTLAIPVHLDHEQTIVAVAAFVTRKVPTTKQLNRIAAEMNVTLDAARRGLAAQQVWQPGVLLNMGQLATERLAADWRLNALDRDVRDLTLNLSTTYEEIALIYRLTQNLKLTSRSEDLAGLAIEWLAEVVPAECLAVQLIPTEATASETGCSEPRLLTFGKCPIDEDEMSDMLDHLELQPGKRPLIFNGSPRATCLALAADSRTCRRFAL